MQVHANPTTYECKACGAPAPLVNGILVLACGCKNPGIVANMRATVTGKGGAQRDNP